MRRACIVLVWLSLVVARVAAQSEALPLQLVWTAPRGCPSAADVRAELARIARVRSGASLRPLAAEARVERTREGYRLVLHTEHEGRQGLRTLDAGDCETLVRSATLVLALAFGPALELASSQPPLTAAGPGELPQPSEEPGTSSAAVGVATPPDEPAQPALREENEGPRDGSPRIGLLLSGFGSAGLLPTAALGAAAGLRLSLGAYALDLRGHFIPQVSDPLSSTIRADYRARGGSVSACRLAPLAALFEVAGCAGARLSSIAARTRGALAPGAANAPWTALTAAAMVMWPRSQWLQIGLELSIAVSLSRPRFVVERLGDVQRVALLVPELSLSVLIGL